MKRILFVIAVCAVLGCGKDDPTGPALATRYTLVRINGIALPFVTVQTGSSKEEVLRGEIRMFVDGTFEDRTTHKSTQGTLSQTFDAVLRGPFEWDASTVTFTVISEIDQTGDDQYVGTMVNDTLSVQVGNWNWKYVER